MEYTKGTSADSGAMKSLAVVKKLMDESKFREAELMLETHLQANPQDGMAYLLMLAAKAQNVGLTKHERGKQIRLTEGAQMLPVFVEHRGLFENFVKNATWEETANAADYVKKYLQDTLKTMGNAAEALDCPTEDAIDFFQMVLNVLYSSDTEAFATLSFSIGEYFIKTRAFEKSAEFLENAKTQGVRVADCQLYGFFASLGLTSEQEFIAYERFHTEMPEYINLLMSVDDNSELYERISRLVEANKEERAATLERRKTQEKEKLQQRYMKTEKSPLQMIGAIAFGLATVASLIYFFFIYSGGNVWKLVKSLLPFGNESLAEGLSGSIGALVVLVLGSLTVIIFLLIVHFRDANDFMHDLEILFGGWLYLITLCTKGFEKLFIQTEVFDDCRECIRTVRKFVLVFTVFALTGYGIWYLMTWLSTIFVVRGILAFAASVVITYGIMMALFVPLLILVTYWLPDFHDTRMESFHGKLWTRGYNRAMFAIPLLSFGLFVLLNKDMAENAIDTVVGLVLVLLGGALFVSSILNKYHAFVKNYESMQIDADEVDKAAKTDLVTGIIYLAIGVASIVIFPKTGARMSAHIGLDVVLLLSGVLHIVSSVFANKKSYL